eukprot:g870.t1
MEAIVARLDAEHNPETTAASAGDGASPAGTTAPARGARAPSAAKRAREGAATSQVEAVGGGNVSRPSVKQSKKKKKKKKMSGDARRRRKKARLAALGGAAPETSVQPLPASTTPKKKKKRHRTNAKCQCSRCGRRLKKRNLRGHLEKCDGTRPEHNPNHVKSEHKDSSTDNALEDLFKAHCEKRGLSGSAEDFAAWSEDLLKNPEGTMKSVRNIAKANRESLKQTKQHQLIVAQPVLKGGATLTLDYAGKKKSFSSEDDESSDDDQ